MISYEPEILAAAGRGTLPERAAAEAVILERRELFSIFFELRIISYSAVLLITTAVGILLKENFDRIGPVAIFAALLAASALCYGSAVRTLGRNEERSIVGDYVLLLGALLLSGAMGFAQSQWHLLGDRWQVGLLLIALVHAAGAYLFNSRLVLTTSITALIGWFGASASFERILFTGPSYGWKCLSAALALFVWRLISSGLHRRPDFNAVFDQFAMNLAFIGSIIEIVDDRARWTGALILAAVAAFALWRGLAKREESFILYAVVYSVIGFDILFFALSGDGGFGFLWVLFSTPMAIVALFLIHQKMKRSA